MSSKDRKMSGSSRIGTFMAGQNKNFPRSSSGSIMGNVVHNTLSRAMGDGEPSGIQLINVKDLYQIQSNNDTLLYNLMEGVDSMKNYNDTYAKLYESRLIRIEDSIIQFNKQFKRNTDLMDKMFDFLDHTNKMQNELYANMKNMLVEPEDTISKQLITDKTEIRGKIMTEKDHAKAGLGIFKVYRKSKRFKK